jgi:hypothetical protein
MKGNSEIPFSEAVYHYIVFSMMWMVVEFIFGKKTVRISAGLPAMVTGFVVLLSLS